VRVADEPLSEIKNPHGSQRSYDRKQSSPAEDEIPIDRIARRVLEPFDVFVNAGRNRHISAKSPHYDNPYSEPMLRVAVRLPAAPGRIGDYLPDVTALEAAGADSIWPEAGASASTEPWILLGAIAAVTHRIRLGTTIGATGGSAGWLDAVDTLGRLSSGRVVVGVRPGRDPKTLVEKLKSPRSAPSPPSILFLCRNAGEARRSARLADGVILPGGADEVQGLRAKETDSELWVSAPVPADKASWVNLISTLEAAGATGVIVPWDPRLIDLLRSAGEPDDRTDLLIATG